MTATPQGSSIGEVRWLFSDRAARLAFYGVAAAVMIVVAWLNAVSRVSDRHFVGLELALWESALWEFSSVGAIYLLLPGLTWMARAAPWTSRPLWRWVAIQVAATAPFSLAHILLMGAIRWAAYSAIGRPYAVLFPLRTEALYEYRKDVLTYFAILAIYWAWRHMTTPPPGMQTSTSAAPNLAEATLEVRDGARRRYVRPAEIAWIEAAGNYAQLHMISGGELLHRSSLAALETELSPHGFVRIHRSRLVARSQVAQIAPAGAGDFSLTLRTGGTVGGSRRYRSGLL